MEHEDKHLQSLHAAACRRMGFWGTAGVGFAACRRTGF